MKLNRTLVLCLAIALSAALAIGGTMAYFTDEDTVKNTFVVGENVDITLDESKVTKDGDEYIADSETRVKENNYEGIYPGAVMPKDPTVTMGASSNAAYVRAKVTVGGGVNWLHLYGSEDPAAQENFMALINNTLGAGWTITGTEVKDSDVVVTILYETRLEAGEQTSPVFAEVKFSADVDQDNVGLFNGSFQIDVVAEAIQAQGFDTAEEAFVAFDAENAPAPDTGDDTQDVPANQDDQNVTP